MDWTGRIIREDKRGSIPAEMPPILARLAIEPKYWIFLLRNLRANLRVWWAVYLRLNERRKN